MHLHGLIRKMNFGLEYKSKSFVAYMDLTGLLEIFLDSDIDFVLSLGFTFKKLDSTITLPSTFDCISFQPHASGTKLKYLFGVQRHRRCGKAESCLVIRLYHIRQSTTAVSWGRLLGTDVDLLLFLC